MSRVMTIWLPRWPVQRRLLAWPEWRAVPVFVCRRERRGVLTVVSWAWARPPRDRATRPAAAPRIEPGMPLAEAMAVLAVARGSHACHVARVEHDDPAADAAALDELARWCRRFSPTVGIEPVATAARRDAVGAPECIRLDVTGTAGFFGGEAALVRTAVWTLAARGLHARVAIADTFAAAWAAAHHTDLLEAPTVAPGRCSPAPVRSVPPGRRRRWAVVPPGAAAAMLAGLPASALRLDEAVIGTLREVGVETVGGVLRLSARSLASRFPPQVSRRLAQFTGVLAEPALVPGGAELPQAGRDFDVPLATGDAVEGIVCAEIERLLGECLAPLVARGAGVQALQVRLGGVSRVPTASAAPTVIDVGLFRPSASVRHLAELVRLRLARAHLPAEVDGVTLEVVAAGPIACRQRVLFTDAAAGIGGSLDAAQQAVEEGMLLDRLAGRLGRAAVFEPRAVADAQPEHAWIAAPPGTTDAPLHAGAPGRAMGRGRVPPGQRPVWMPARPLRLDLPRAALVAVAPDGPPVRLRIGTAWHTIVAAHGPERIETAWWRGPTVRRDYYVAETETGERFWVFRRLRDGAWFLHGTFA